MTTYDLSLRPHVFNGKQREESCSLLRAYLPFFKIPCAAGICFPLVAKLWNKYLGNVKILVMGRSQSIHIAFSVLVCVSNGWTCVNASLYGTLLLVTAIIISTCKYFVFMFPFSGCKKKRSPPPLLLIKTFSCYSWGLLPFVSLCHAFWHISNT